MQQKCTPHSLKYYREDDINSLDQRFCENGLIHSLPKTLSMLVHAVPTAEMQPSKAQLPSCPQKKSDIKSEFWANGQFCLAICYLGCYEIWYRWTTRPKHYMYCVQLDLESLQGWRPYNLSGLLWQCSTESFSVSFFIGIFSRPWEIVIFHQAASFGFRLWPFSLPFPR